jgi:uncharacterized protein (TIGR03382 family)
VRGCPAAHASPPIHALDTSRRIAHCIDLDALAGNRYLWRLHTTEDGRELLIRDRAETELVVETKTFHVRSPTVTGGSQGGVNWEVFGVTSAAALVAAAAFLFLARRRHQLAVER